MLAKEKNLKVVHLVQEFPVLSETFIPNEASRLRELGVQVTLLAFDRGEGYPSEPAAERSRRPDDELSRQFSRAGDRCCYIHRFQSGRLRGLTRLLNALCGVATGLASPASSVKLRTRLAKGKVPMRKLPAVVLLARCLRKLEIDILHAQFGHLGLLCLPVKSLLGLPLVTSFRGQDVSIVSRMSAEASRALFREGEIFLARSRDMKADLLRLGCPDEKIRVNHSSVDLDRIPFSERCPPPAGSDAVVLFVGRFVEKKGLLVAIRAFARCLAGRANLQLRLIGGGELGAEAKALADSLAVAPKIRFLGPTPYSRVISEMGGAHVFLLPCQTGSDGEKEGIPKALMEAQASGLPVVSTFHAGIPECVLDGKTGLLAKEGDAADVAGKLMHLLEHPESWPSMGRAGREHIEKEFNIRRQASELKAIYEAVASK